MKRLWILASAILVFASMAAAADSKYEVYYFHASWRCGNCTNAEAWAGQAVESLKTSNPNVAIEFAPKQLETNADLVKATGARRVDLIVAEIQDGKMKRFHNIGNLLDVISSKALTQKTSMDGIMEFISESPEKTRLSLPVEYAKLEKQINDPKKVGIFIVVANAGANSNPAVVETLSTILERDFKTLIAEQAIVASMVDASNQQNKEFLDDLGAKGGEVVVSLLGVEGVDDFTKFPWPEKGADDSHFVSEFTTAMKKMISQGQLD